MAAFLTLDRVCHVGTLDLSDRTGRSSLEAMMLSVSVDPDEWRSIARCGGAPEWTISAVGAAYLDAHSLSDQEEAEIEEWAISKGYASRLEIWRSWFFDGESDDWRFFLFDNEAAALAQVDDDDEECPQTENGELVEKVVSLVLTDAGMAALERWGDPLSGQDGAIILWAREKALPENPAMVGIWWPEIRSQEDLSCPRGGIFPEKLSGMMIERGWEPDGPETDPSDEYPAP